MEEEQCVILHILDWIGTNVGSVCRRKVRVQAELKKANSTAQQIDLAGLRTKLNRRIHRLRKLQGTYSPSSIVALEAREAPPDELPEDEPLFLPSSLSSVGQEFGCADGLVQIEWLMRDAQCRTALVRLRNQLHIKSRYLNYKKLHARHQGANTRSRTIVNRNESKIRLHSEKYQAAFNALVRLEGGDESKVGWRKLKKADIRCMEDEEDLERKEKRRERALERRRKREDELRAHGEEIPAWEEEDDDEEEGGSGGGSGKGRREVSWIWTAAGTSGTDANFEDGKFVCLFVSFCSFGANYYCTALRIEWAKAWARKRRYDEEVRFLTEEFRRLPISLEYEANVWLQRAKGVQVGVIQSEFAQGLVAYAMKQAALFQDLATRARTTEAEPRLARGKKRPRVPMFDPLVSMPEIEEESENEEAEEEGDDDDEDRGDVGSDEELIMGGEVDDD